jgi:uncharacterized membrane protein
MTWSQRLLAALYAASGLLHFAKPRAYEAIVPDYLPAHRELVLVSGAAELACAAGVALPRTRRSAGWGIVALLVAVFPANVHMALHPQRYAQIPRWALWARLPLQPLAVWWALRSTGARG